MQRFETWRADLGGYMVQAVAADGRVDITVPGVDLSGSEPLQPPADRDSRSPIRGWEAVATSYFLADSEADLSRGIPPDTFRRTYCLYDPHREISEQAEENEQGCSPRKVWDEWDVVSTGVITEVFGIELPVSIGLEFPIRQEHPENRELGLRQAQAGVGRLALGPLVALYPMMEANISLMLALAASILYLTIPIMLTFGVFAPVQPLVMRLLLRLVTIIGDSV